MLRAGSVVLFFLMLTSLILPSGYGQARERYSPLAYKMPEGARLTYLVSDNTRSRQQVLGTETEGVTLLKATVTLTFEDTDRNGNLTFVLKNEALHIDLHTAHLDSTLSNPTGIVGKRVRKTILPNGDQVDSVELDAVQKLSVLPGLTSEQEFLPNLPDKPLAVGESATVADVDSTHSYGGVIRTRSTIEYTLQGMKSKAGYECLALSLKGRVGVNGNGVAQGVPFTVEGDGTVSGSLCFAVEEGVLVSHESESTVNMIAEMAGEQKMTLVITQTATSHVDLVK